MRTLIDRINTFESGTNQTVLEFNKIFPYCKLKNLADNLDVEIGELVDSDTTRYVLVGELVVKHRFDNAVNKYTLDEELEENKDEDY